MEKTVFTLLITFLTYQAFSQHTLTIVADNIDEIKGEIEFCLYDNDEGFMSKALRCEYNRVLGDQITHHFDSIPSGDYAVVIFHDLNGNRDLDTGWMRIPTEPYGFSNNPSTRFGPPDFEKASFQVTSDKEITIRLK